MPLHVKVEIIRITNVLLDVSVICYDVIDKYSLKFQHPILASALGIDMKRNPLTVHLHEVILNRFLLYEDCFCSILQPYFK